MRQRPGGPARAADDTSPTMKRINKRGPRVLGGFTAPPRLDDRRLSEAARRRAIVVDTRPGRRVSPRRTSRHDQHPARPRLRDLGRLAPALRPRALLIVDEGSPHAVGGPGARALAGIGLDHLAGYAGAWTRSSSVRRAKLQTIPGIGLGELTQAAPARGRRAARCAKPRGNGGVGPPAGRSQHSARRAGRVGPDHAAAAVGPPWSTARLVLARPSSGLVAVARAA